jgi:hypothetical protein
VLTRAGYAVLRTMQRHVYSTELYKRIILTLRFRLMESRENQQRLSHLEDEDALLARPKADIERDRQITAFQRFSDDEVRTFTCRGMGAPGPPDLSAALAARAPELQPWFAAVDGFQSLQRSGRRRVMFFINMAPTECAGADRFVDWGNGADNAALLDTLGRGTPAVSSWQEFLYYRPSQMPLAAGHSLGNSNVVKAQVLFTFMRDRVLPPLLPPVHAQ